MSNQLDVLEKILAESNKDNVALIADGLTKQHFIELDAFTVSRGNLYENLVKKDWIKKESSMIQIENGEIKGNSADDETSKTEEIFPTEVNESVLQEARKRLESTLLSGPNALSTSSLDKSVRTGIAHMTFSNYLLEKPEQIKEDLMLRANYFYEKSLRLFEDGMYERAIITLNKAFSLNSFNIQFYLLRCECFILLCDYRSAITSINKLLSLISLWTDHNDKNYSDLKHQLNEKTVFCYYMHGQAYFDCKLYLEALDSFNKASELKPTNLQFKIRSVSCLYAMNRINDALALLNKIINEDEMNNANSNLFVLRARLNFKENNISNCYYDLKNALNIDPDHKEASNLMVQLESSAENLRNSGLGLSLSNRVTDALNKMTGAITFNPDKAEYHLQRGILYKRLRDFNSAIDDFLLGLEKMNHEENKDPVLFANFQKQILLTYNDFSIQCFEKGFYDDAIVLLNKAIKIEKNEKGFYINRGDCFYKKNEKRFALLDYEQAHEIDSNDENIKNRIANIYYEMGVEKYDEKNYQEATKNFKMAITNCPNKCKYYISKARTLYFLEDKIAAQIDICISILLDPSNPEIPNIISRIFPNQNLSDVLKSQQMKESRSYLKKLNIPSVFDMGQNQSVDISTKTESDKVSNLKKEKNDAIEEELVNLKLINQKKKVNSVLKEALNVNLKSDKPKLLPLGAQINKNIKKNPKEINWRKFNLGINTSSI